MTTGSSGSSFTDALRKGSFHGVVFIDSQTRKATLSPEAVATLGIRSGPPAGEVDFDQLPSRLQAIAREAWSSEQPLPPRHLDLHPVDQVPYQVEITASRLVLAGRTPAVVLVLRDPGGGYGKRFQQLDRLANIGVLTAGMAHEIKNALVAGKTFIDLLLEKQADVELAEIVRRELGRIDAIVSRILRFAGPARPAAATVSLHEVLDHSLRLVQSRIESKLIVLEKAFEAPTDTVAGYDYELQQAFVNLLLNAVEAMPANGRLTVRTDLAPQDGPPPGQLQDSFAAPSIRIHIQDTGPGIPPALRARLFEPFFTTKPDGTGLGLAITRNILQEHRGTIKLESPPGPGTTFEIRLPIQP